MSQAHVQVVLDDSQIPQGIDAALQTVGATVSFGPISEALRSGVKPTADAVIVIPRDDSPNSREDLRELIGRVANNPRATLVIQPEGCRITPPNTPASVPVSYSERSGIESLATRISTMISMRGSLEALHREYNNARGADEQQAERHKQQLLSAGRVQRELMPSTVPRFGDVSFSVIYRARDYVSGDIYDIRRLDDEHVAIAISDVQGHGISAALLTVFIKRALAGEFRRGGSSRPPSPDEVLLRLNEELLDAELRETQFSAAVYALLNLRTKRLEMARGGAPYPILRRADGRCELLDPPGFLIGITETAKFATQSVELSSGDAVLFYSDGVEQIIQCAEPASSEQGAIGGRLHASAGTPNYEPDKFIAGSGWYARLGREGVDAAMEEIAARHDTLRRLERPLDDLTALALRID